MVTHGDRRERLANGAAVPDHLFRRGDVAQCDLVASGNRGLRPDLTAANYHGLAGHELNPRDGDVISRVQLDGRRGGSGSGLNMQKTHDPNISAVRYSAKG